MLPLTQYSLQFSSAEGGEGSRRADSVHRGLFWWGNPLQMCTNHPLLNYHCYHRWFFLFVFLQGIGNFCRRWQDHLRKCAGFCINQTNRGLASRDKSQTGGIRMTPKPVRGLTTGYLLINSHRCSPMPFKHFGRAFFSVHVCVSPILFPVIMAFV